MRSLEKDPALRYQSAEEFVAALEQARRQPTRQIVMDRTPGEPWVEEPVPAGSRWWVWLLVLLVLAAVAAGAYFLLAGEKVTVPNLVGRNASDAADILHRRGLEIAYVNREDDNVPRDEVISQEPDAGTEVREGDTVTVTISGGKGTVPVPDVVGDSRENAEQALRALGFKTSVKQEFSDDVPEGDVISVSPAVGRQATKGRTITLTVSKGVEGVPVPGVVGNAVEAATQTLQGAGLQVDVTEREDKRPPGTVLAQNPPEGTAVAPNTTVEITVAKARPSVPDVTSGNPTVEEATQMLEEAGYKVKTTERQDPANVGRVIGQSPAPNTPRSTGGTVTIAVGIDPNATPTATPTP